MKLEETGMAAILWNAELYILWSFMFLHWRIIQVISIQEKPLFHVFEQQLFGSFIISFLVQTISKWKSIFAEKMWTLLILENILRTRSCEATKGVTNIRHLAKLVSILETEENNRPTHFLGKHQVPASWMNHKNLGRALA